MEKLCFRRMGLPSCRSNTPPVGEKTLIKIHIFTVQAASLSLAGRAHGLTQSCSGPTSAHLPTKKHTLTTSEKELHGLFGEQAISTIPRDTSLPRLALAE
ncbi:unnamed protein product [Musa acuminata subsp. burmannicoides]